jgi:hypothetical protein
LERKKLSEFVLGRLVAGALVIAPTYLAVLLVLKGIKSLAGIMKPFAQLLPKWLPADQVLSLLRERRQKVSILRK